MGAADLDEFVRVLHWPLQDALGIEAMMTAFGPTMLRTHRTWGAGRMSGIFALATYPTGALAALLMRDPAGSELGLVPFTLAGACAIYTLLATGTEELAAIRAARAAKVRSIFRRSR